MTLIARLAAAVSGAIVAGSILYLRPATTGRCFTYHRQPGEPLPPGTRLLGPNGPLCPIPSSPGPARWWVAGIVLAVGALVFLLARPRRRETVST